MILYGTGNFGLIFVSGGELARVLAGGDPKKIVFSRRWQNGSWSQRA